MNRPLYIYGKTTLLLVVLLFRSLTGLGQEYLINARDFTTEEGLSHNQVLSLVQDREGFMWIGTKYGVNRFDGYNFQWYTKETHGLNSNNITDLFEDRSGNIWVIDAEVKFKRNYFYSIDLLSPESSEVRTFKEKFGDKAPFELADILELRHNLHGNICLQLDDGRCFLLKGNDVQPYEPATSLKLIHYSSKGHVWVQDKGQIIQLDKQGNRTFTHALRANEEVTNAVEDADGRIWFVVSHRWEEREFEVDHDHSRVIIYNKSRIRNLFPGKKFPEPKEFEIVPCFKTGKTWIIFENGAMEVDKELFLIGKPDIKLPEGRQLHTVHHYIDNNGVLWQGHRDGFRLLDIQKSKFNKYLNDGDLRYPSRGIIESDSLLIVNTETPEGGVVLNLQSGEKTSYSLGNPLFNQRLCHPAIKTGNGEFWTANDRLWQLDKSGMVVRNVDPHPDSPEKGPKIWSFFKDSDGTFWMGMVRNLLYSYNENRIPASREFTQYNQFESMKLGEEWHFFEDDLGIWISAQNGLYLLDKQKGLIARYSEQDTGRYHLPANTFYYMYKDSQEVYWLATGDAGLVRVEKGYFKSGPQSGAYRQFSRNSGLPSNEVYAIYEDRRNRLWISSGNGLIQFNKESFESIVYYEEQGLSHNEFNKLSHFQSETGRLYFGGLNGVTTFIPEDFYQQEQYDARLTLSLVQLFSNKTQSMVDITRQTLKEKKILLRPGDKLLSLSLCLQDYFYSDKLRYFYQIEGLNNEWTEASGNGIQLSGLAYGRYTLRMRGQGPDNRFSSSELSIKLIVKSPIYMRWWFITLLAVLFGISVWQTQAWRIRSMRARQEKLEGMVAERTKSLENEKQRSRNLLLNILPRETADELLAKGSAQPQVFKSATVLFADFVGFTRLASDLSPQEVINILNECFSAFDEICDKHRLERIKTIGDAYMCVGGVPRENDTNAVDAVHAAWEIMEWMKDWNAKRVSENLPVWKLRIGIHTGELVAGVIGKKKFAYDVWGDTVNTASRLESHSEAGKINLSREMYDQVKGLYTCTYRGEVQVKNIGKVPMYYVDSRV